MPRRAAKLDLGFVHWGGATCGACHKPFPAYGGICFGRPGLVIPAINVCKRCIENAAAILGEEDRVKGLNKERKN